MKAWFIIVFLGFSQENKIEWLTDFPTAKKLAKKHKKPILMYFNGSDWCAPCIQLKKDFFEKPEFVKQVSRFIMVMVDIPRRQDVISEAQYKKNKEVAVIYNKKKVFPLLIAFSHKGKEIKRISSYSSYNSYRDTSYHFKFLDDVLKKY